MKHPSSRRNFLAAGLAFPAAGLGAQAEDPGPKIEFRKLGSTGLKVSTLGFGCMLASDPVVVEHAVELGINYIDTARAYQRGNNERMVGAALGSKRDQVVLATKAPGATKAEVLEELDTSLAELGTDHVDIWFLHSRNSPEALTDELLEAQRIAVESGKARFRGVSFHFNMAQMLDHVVKLGCMDVALLSYNFTLPPDVGDAIRGAREQGLGIVAMKVMAGGYARIRRGDRLYGRNPDELTARLQQPNAMLAALKWTLRNESVDTAIIGMTDFQELEEDVRAMSEPLTADEETLLALETERIGPRYCRGCGTCSGVCEKGVRVADTLRHLMYAEGYGQFAMARECYLEQPAGARQARCSECDACSVQCPNGVDVRRSLIHAQKLFA